MTPDSFRLERKAVPFLKQEGWKIQQSYACLGEVMEAVTETVVQRTKTRHINDGACFMWALLCSLYNPRIELISAEDHAFIAVDGEFWDSEGRVIWENSTGWKSAAFPFQGPAVIQNRAQFALYWLTGGIRKDLLQPLIPEIIPKHMLPEWNTIQHIYARKPFGKPLLKTQASLSKKKRIQETNEFCPASWGRELA